MGEVSPINRLYAEYADKGFEFLTVYVREPHPGENYPEHHTWEQKLQYAKDAREQDNIETPVVIDDLAGTMHTAYGEMPNMVYVINKDGRVFYRSMWTDHAEIESVLQDMVRIDEAAEKGERLRTSYTERLVVTVGYGSQVSEKVLGRAGPKAAADMQAAFRPPR